MENKPTEKSTFNFFGDIVTAHIDAFYKKGKFYDYYTEQEIKLKEYKHAFSKGVHVRIIAPLNNIPDDNYETHSQKVTELLIKKGESLFFQMDYSHQNIKYKFWVQLLEDLCIGKKGNKPAKLSGCRCIVVEGIDLNINNSIIDFKPIECGSLNHAFTQTSVKYRPNNASHTCNVFKTFRTGDGTLLDSLR